MVKFVDTDGNDIKIDSDGNLILLPHQPSIMTLSQLKDAILEGASFEDIKDRLAVGIDLEVVKTNYDILFYQMIASRTKLGRLLYG